MNARIINNLKTCADFTPRTFATSHPTNAAAPLSTLAVSTVNAQQHNNTVGVVTDAAHRLRTGDLVTITDADAAYANGTWPVTVTAPTAFEVGPFVEASSDGEILGAVIVAHLYFRAAALFAKTPAGADNHDALTLGYASDLLPIELAIGGEYALISQIGSRHDLATVYVKPAAANAGNGIVCILY